MRNFDKKRGLIILLAGAAMVLPGLAVAQEQEQEQGASEGIGDIVVTAQRREQNLQDVPVAVTAFSGETLADLGIHASSDIANVVPNVEIGLPGGAGNQPLIYIRGVGLSDTNRNNSGPNGVYMDEVYISSPSAQTFALFDLERVEVLKGPQGTLYGRNATGGAINFISAKPSRDFQAQGSLSYGSFDTITGEAAVGGPLSDSVRVRLAGTGTHSNGYIHNLLTGRRENGQGSFALRGQIAADLTENIDTLINVHGGRVNVRSPQFRSLGMIDPDTGDTCGIAAIQANQCGNVLGYVSPDGFYDGMYDRSDRLKSKSWGVAGRLNWHLGDVTLTSISAYDYDDKLHQEDSDASPNRLLHLDYAVRSKTFTQELRLSGSTGSVNWVGGVYYLHEVLKQNQTGDVFGELRALTPEGGADPEGLTTGGAPVIFSRTLNRQTTEAAAVFGQAEIELTPALRATIGARYNYERKRFLAAARFEDKFMTFSDGDGGFVTEELPGGILPLYSFDNRKSFDNFSFKVGLDYDLTDDVMAYATVSTGFKSGGFNGGYLSFDPVEAEEQAKPFNEETLTAYEIGLKSTLFDRRLRFNTAAFYYDYKDLQLYTLTNCGQVGCIPVSALANAANAAIYGAELEMIAKPVDRLNITMNLGLLKTKIKEFVSAGTDYSGNRMPLSPKVNFSGVVNYEIPLSSGIALALQPAVSYRSSHFFSTDNNPLLRQSGYWLVDGRVAVKDEDGRWEAAFFARNLTRKKYINFAVDLADFGFVEQFQGQPRMFGAEVRFKY